MSESGIQIVVTAKSRILKFHVGADPDKDEPYEILEQEEVFTGAKAEALIKQIGGEDSAPE